MTSCHYTYKKITGKLQKALLSLHSQQFSTTYKNVHCEFTTWGLCLPERLVKWDWVALVSTSSCQCLCFSNALHYSLQITVWTHCTRRLPAGRGVDLSHMTWAWVTFESQTVYLTLKQNAKNVENCYWGSDMKTVAFNTADSWLKGIVQVCQQRNSLWPHI